MKRLLPQSLFARMVIVLLGGLVVAQLLSFAVHWRERGEFITRSIGMRSAQRIGDIVRLLDTIEPAERAKIVNVLSSPPLRIALDLPPLGPAAEDAEKEEQAEQFAAVVQRALGEEFSLVVQASDAARRRPPWPGYGMGAGRSEGRGKWRADAGGNEQSEPGSAGPGMRRFAGVSFVVPARRHHRSPKKLDKRPPQE